MKQVPDIEKLIAEADEMAPNTVPAAKKTQWLTALNSQIEAELQPILIPDEKRPALDKVDLYYLVMRIFLENGELDCYNKYAAIFNQLWRSFCVSIVHGTAAQKEGQP